jgi:cytochrome c oxidase subunit I+III
VRSGRVSPARALDLRIGRLFHAYAASAGLVAVGFVWVIAALGAAGGPA